MNAAHTPTRNLVIIAVIALTLYGVWAWVFIHRSSFVDLFGVRQYCLQDDAMISLRYARNLAEGHGLVFNIGEHVEGYTNPLWTVLLAVLVFVFGPSGAIPVAQAFGAVCVAMCALAAGGLATEAVSGASALQRRRVRLAATIGVLAAYPLSFWSLMGMEAGLCAALVTTAALLATRFARTGSRLDLGLCTAACVLAYYGRPDMLVFGGSLLVYCTFASSGLKGWRRIALLSWAWGALSLAVALHLLLRLAYYGALVPNTYTLKMTGRPVWGRLLDGVRYVQVFVFALAPVLVAGAVSLLKLPSRPRALLLCLASAAVAYQIYVGGDAFPRWRMLVPVVPALIVVAVDTIGAAAEHTRWLKGGVGRAMPMVAALVTAMLLGVGYLGEQFLVREPLCFERNRHRTEIGTILREVTTTDATIGVLAAGAIPYFAERRTVDFLGKVDPHVASLPADISGSAGTYRMNSQPGHNKYDLDYSIRQLHPTYVQQAHWCAQDLSRYVAGTYDRCAFGRHVLWLKRGSPRVHWHYFRQAEETDQPKRVAP